MSSEFEKKLEKYAEVILKIGLNLQPDQRLLIGTPNPYNYGAPIELTPLIRLIVAKAYQIGAKFVETMWDDEQLRLIRFQHAPRDSFEEFPKWRTDAAFEFGNSGDANLLIVPHNPELLRDQDQELISTFQQAYYKHGKSTSELRAKNAMNWTVIVAPVEGWTEKIFPQLPPNDRKTKLWDTLFKLCRIDQNDPISAWQDHLNELVTRSDFLNKKKYDALKLKAPGTDLTIGLPSGHIWRGARMTAQNGIDFTANIPTEEIFTMPHKDKTEGIVSTTKPLSYGGTLIEKISFQFSEGRVIKATAKKGEAHLLKLLEMDDGAARLGEIALVPHNSPISQSNLLFYNTLLDENASSHIALGRGLRFALEKGYGLTNEEFGDAGGNNSLIHEDLMIGSNEMDIDGLKNDGTIEPIMRKGEWAFEV